MSRRIEGLSEHDRLTDPRSLVQDRYDRWAANELDGRSPFESLTRAKGYFRARKLTTALRMASFPAGGTLLEIGCSVGQFTFPLAKLGYQICGMDLSPNSIEVAKQRAAAQGVTRATFMVGEAETLRPLTDGQFDGVVSFSTLRYVGNLPQALSEIYRVLKPGGRAVIDVPNRWCPWFYLKPWLGSERHPHDHWFASAKVKGEVKRAGFRDVQARHLLFTPTLAPDALLPLFQRVDWIGERLAFVRRFAGIIMVSATKS